MDMFRSVTVDFYEYRCSSFLEELSSFGALEGVGGDVCRTLTVYFDEYHYSSF